MRSIPLPRRGLRTVCILLVLPLTAFLIVYSTYSSHDHPPSHVTKHYASIDDEEKPSLGMLWSPYKAYQSRRDDIRGRGAAGIAFLTGGGDSDADDDIPQQQPRIPLTTGKGKRHRKKMGSTVIGKATGEHTWGDDGMMVVNPAGRHPIWDLIERGRKEWDEKIERQSKTLDEAVINYRRRYNRAPPKGFDKWWEYAMKNDVKMVDEYDQISADLEPFHALPPATLRGLQSQWEKIDGTYVIACPSLSSTPGKATKSGSTRSFSPKSPGCYLAQTTYAGNEEEERAGTERAMGQLDLLSGIQETLMEILGDDEELRVTFYAHDVPFQFVGHEYRSQLVDSASIDEFLDVGEHKHDLAHIGWGSACSPDRPLRRDYDHKVLPDVRHFWKKSHKKTFIYDHKKSMDPCEHPTLTHLTGFLASYGKGPRPSEHMYPIMAMCTTHLHSDVLTVAYEQFTEEVGNDPDWDEKQSERMLWRGSTTGILFDEGLPWNISQRIRLVEQAERRGGMNPLLHPREPEEAVGEAEMTPVGALNDMLLDVAFVGKPIQCAKQEICDEVEEMFEFRKRQGWDKANQYKYIFDIDGNGWSSRFKRLMSTNSLILKSTVFPEWYADRIQAWVHYIPVKADLTDLYDIMTFFRGSSPAAHDGHDDLAKEIASEGKKWSMEYWRKEDIISYMFRLYLEYARLMSQDREAHSYSG